MFQLKPVARIQIVVVRYRKHVIGIREGATSNFRNKDGGGVLFIRIIIERAT
jgi:exonuclease III